MLKKKFGGGKENVKFQFNLSVDYLFDFKNSSIGNKQNPDEDVFYAVRNCYVYMLLNIVLGSLEER